MPTPQQQIDAFLGEGSYSESMKMNQTLEQENKRFEWFIRNMKAFPAVIDKAYADFTTINEISKNYSMALNYITVGHPIDKEKAGKLHDIYSIALILAEDENDLLDAFWGTGFFAAWVVFPFMLLEAKANAMLAATRQLQEELTKAEHEVKNARHKLYIHAAITVFESFFAEISIPARAALYLTDIVVDKALGPDSAPARQRYVGDVTPGVKQFSEAMHHIPEYGERAHEIAEKTGKVAMLATFYFDFDEIGEGDEKVEKIKSALERVSEAYEALRKLIEDNAGKLNQFLAALRRALTAIESARVNADTDRKALSADSAEYGYRGGNASAWLSVP